jgi:hypothetical protein
MSMDVFINVRQELDTLAPRLVMQELQKITRGSSAIRFTLSEIHIDAIDDSQMNQGDKVALIEAIKRDGTIEVTFE